MRLPHLCTAAAVSLTAAAGHAADLDDLRGDLAGSGVQPPPELTATTALEEALADKRLREVERVAEGLAAAVYEGGGRTVIVLAAGPEAAGAYLLPGGERLTFQTPDGAALEPGSVLDRRLVFATSGSNWTDLQYYTRLSPANPGPVDVTGASVDESVPFEVVRVSAGGGAGAAATLREGLARAAALLAEGKNARVRIAPGLYREGGLSLPGNLEDGGSGTLVIEGVGDGEVVVSGADDFSGGWSESEEHPGVWSKPWPHRFGMGGQPWAPWNFLLPAEACRAELLAVDGELYLPVMLEKFAWTDPDGAVPLGGFDDGSDVPGRWEPIGLRSPGDLPEGGYGVVESEGVVYLRPPAGTDLNQAAVEAGVRPQLLALNNRRDTVLRNLTFRHSVQHPGGSAGGARPVAVSLGGRNLLVEDCRFEENGAFGLDLGEAVTDATIRGSAFNANGWKGLGGGFQPDNVLYENNESSSNNWRGHMGGEHSWDAAAVKLFGVNSARGVAFRGHRSFANLTHGLWLDQSFVPYAPVVIEGSTFYGNHFGAELYLEKLTGPVEVRGNTVWNAQGRYGVNGTSWNLRFTGNRLRADGDRPVWFLHRRGNESDYANASKDWVVEGNTVEAAGPEAVYYLQDSTPAQYEAFVETYRGGSNTYAHPQGAAPFVGLDGEPLGLEGWRALTGQEEGSVAAAANSPIELSAEDRALYEAARARTDRFLAIAAAVEASSGPPFERAVAAVGNNVAPLPLAPLLNRPLTGADAWIGGGQQLPHLTGGRRVFAGVPFELADPAGGADAAVALRSAKLPEAVASAEVPVGARVEAVYVLHGSGWVDGDPAPFGSYELVYADGGSAGVAVSAPAADGSGSAEGAEPLVGDWYGAFQPFDGEAVRHARLPADASGVAANLYVVELVNPEPAREVASVRLRGDAERDSTLIVLGVTAVRR